MKWKLIFWLTLIGFLTSFLIHLVLFLIGTSDISYTMRQYPVREWQKREVEKPITQIIGSGSELKLGSQVLLETNNHLSRLISQGVHRVEHNGLLFTELTLESFAIVDKQSILVTQSNNSPLQPGDIGNQLPIASRDDLSDALEGRNNSGIEPVGNNGYLVIRPILNSQSEILGALITTQYWQFSQDRGPLFYIPLFQAVLLALGYTISSFIWIIPSTLVLGLIVARVVSKKLSHFNSTIAHWENGNFLPKLNVLGNDEIAQSFHRLNQMAYKLGILQNELRETASIEERQQLAAELHDTVKQQLFATNLKLSTAEHMLSSESEESKKILQQCIEQNQKAFSQINDLIVSLNPIHIGEDLVKALSDAIDKWQIKTGILVTQNLMPIAEIAEPKQLAIYRSIMEALQNVFKHSNSNQVNIQLSQTDNKIEWQVSNPVVSPSELRYGQGLSLMEKRINSLKGSLDIKISSTNKASHFVLNASIPL
ncbi:MAG: histidine kinase [Kangiellaceae bacterium]|nr:histidine kinase [Kangiellaceae bacterium]MCW8997135.1 histidine kinase [Kangiellaceae bacterium]